MILILRERLLKTLANHKEEVTNSLLTNSVDDFASYRYLIGKIKGIDDSIDLIKNTFKGENDAQGD